MDRAAPVENPTEDETPPGPAPLWAPLLVLGLVLAAAWPALSAELVYDDLQIIRQNPRITSLANWKQAFSATYWEFLEPDVAARVGYWRPLATLAYTFVYVLSDGATAAFHATSVAVHLLAVLVAFRFARRLFRSTFAGFWAALLFGLHPINVESWAWVSALNGVLAGLFSLLALDAHVAWRRGGSRGVPARTLLFALLALLSKELAVAVLPLVLAVDVVLSAEGRGAGGAGRSDVVASRGVYLQLAGVLFVYWLARALVFGTPGAGIERVTTDFGPDVDVVRLLRLRVELLGGGLWLAAVPDPSLFRPFRPVIPAHDPIFLRDLAVLVALVVGLALAWRARWRRLTGVLAFCVLAHLPVVLRVASLGSFPLSDRFLYLTTLGAALVVVLVTLRWPRAVSLPVLVALAGAAGVASHARARTWQDEERLFRTAAEESPRSPYVHWGLGRVLLEQYQRERAVTDLRAALECFDRSADLLERALTGDSSIFATRQDAEQTNVGLGWCYLFEAELEGSRDFSTAQAVFEATLEGTPTSESAYTGLGVALQAQGRPKEAERAYRKALELNPNYVEAHHNLAQLHWQQRDWRRAQHHVEEALGRRPDHFPNVVLLARIQYERNHLDRARATAQRARRLDPESPEPLEILAVLAGAQADGRAAMRLLDEALELDPDYGRIHYLRANEFVRRGDTSSAIASLRRACDLMPRDFPSHHDLGALLLQSGAGEAAVPYLTRAYELCRDPARLVHLRRTLPSLAVDEPAAVRRWALADRLRGEGEWVARWIEKALALAPDDPTTLYLRANHRRVEGDPEGALRDLERIAELDPDAFQALLDLGELLVAQGRAAEAVPYLERAVAVGPPEAWDEGLREVARQRAERELARLRPQAGE